MPTLPDAVIKKHWIVGPFVPAVLGATGLERFGMFGTFQDVLHGTLEDAKTRARELAASAPGTYFVIYEATWYAYTDITPVNLRRVGEAAIV